MARLPFVFQLLLHSCLVALSRAVPSTSPPNAPPNLVARDAAPVSTACGDIVNSGNIVFNASDVYACLTSVPFNAAVATKFIQYYRDTIQFQSTLSYLKTPPTSYQQPAVDFLGGLDFIQQSINNGDYANQYEFEAALQTLIYATHDDHIELAAGILAVFSFGTDHDIVSVSSDGIQVPKVYLTDDLTNSQEPSPIKTINGEEAIEYLSAFAAKNAIGSLEPHADFNQLMTSPANDIQAFFTTWGGGATFYPGDTLTFVLENKTQITTRWLAVYNSPGDTGPLETGGDFYNFFVLGFYPASYDPYAGDYYDNSTDDGSAATSAAATAAATSAAATTVTSASPTPSSWDNTAYPDAPDVYQADLSTFGGGYVSGYFLRQSNIAVLSIPSFLEYGGEINDFSSTITRFLTDSKAAGMTKVVVDLQQNYGGDILLAFDTFKQFFPTIDPFGGSRLRATSPANVIGETITTYWNNLTQDDEDYYNLLANEWVSSVRIDANTGENFTTWDQFFGPHSSNGDNFTTTQQYNLSSLLFDTFEVDDDEDFAVYGFAARPTNQSQPYAAEDIIILSDALCSSTCSLFMEMMHFEAGVRTVVAGGLPYYGPMQTPSLSRGAREYDVIDILDPNIAFAQTLLEDDNDPNSDFLPNRTEALDVWVSSASINLRDQVRRDEDIPLQFVYEAANCRIFFTPKTFYNYTALWQYAADAIWSNSSLCVTNSTGYAVTNASDTTGPSQQVLPKTTTAAQDQATLGSIILSAFESTDSLDLPVLDKSLKVSDTAFDGQLCSSTKKCPANYFCFEKFTVCEKGVQKYVPSCVNTCQVDPGHCPNNGNCMPLKATSTSTSGVAEETGTTDASISVATGFCQPPKSFCRTTTNTKTTSNRPAPPP